MAEVSASKCDRPFELMSLLTFCVLFSYIDYIYMTYHVPRSHYHNHNTTMTAQNYPSLPSLVTTAITRIMERDLKEESKGGKGLLRKISNAFSSTKK